MEYKIRGTTMQVADLQLKEGESVFTETGGLSWMSPNFDMKTNVKGGLMKGIGRMFGGESLFLTTFSCTSGQGLISFSNEFPGKIIPLELKWHIMVLKI